MREYERPGGRGRARFRAPDRHSLRAGGARDPPGLVVLRRKASLAPPGARPGGQESAWLDITARQFRDEVAALAKGFMAAGIGEGDRVASCHAPATSGPWSTTRSGPRARSRSRCTKPPPPSRWSGSRPTRARRRSWSRPGAPGGDRRGAAPTAGRAADVADRGRFGRSVARRAGGRGRRGRRGRPRSAPGVGQRQRLRHDHLHLGHHRPPEGMRDHPRQPAGQRAERDPLAVGDLRLSRRVEPCSSCPSRTRSRASSRWAPSRLAPCSATSLTRERCCRI